MRPRHGSRRSKDYARQRHQDNVIKVGPRARAVRLRGQRLRLAERPFATNDELSALDDRDLRAVRGRRLREVMRSGSRPSMGRPAEHGHQ
ncbi:hypothetical protein SGL43_07073 [Streptomyces globisporus]|uniref:DUF1127 domain-containing protein n=1 Tax=Streptomyces globisporus TaxID=1908 RepID=A0ABM9H8M7_STRGL|nr:hypothetical protein SGL43_07073 [Streptomyces globisporus]